MRIRIRQSTPNLQFINVQKTKFLLPSGFKKFTIRCPADLEILLMNNRTYAGELSHNLSARVKTSIVKRAAELDVKLLNSKSKLKTEEKKKE
jgi:large subunit ribosomal protein L32e